MTSSLQLDVCSHRECMAICAPSKNNVLSQQVAFHQCEINVHDVYTSLDLSDMFYFMIGEHIMFPISKQIGNILMQKLHVFNSQLYA